MTPTRGPCVPAFQNHFEGSRRDLAVAADESNDQRQGGACGVSGRARVHARGCGTVLHRHGRRRCHPRRDRGRLHSGAGASHSCRHCVRAGVPANSRCGCSVGIS
ncbi:hypothetical protein BACI71_270001 [Bacillus mycoides]|uniref:Uncharacterized protein n=1 Tax=Bacillus mycoides TaxID=1405 RepID=A0A653VZF8_BACMY|nr:hypothetical protein BACI71_270001 [Bacillus mycoides]